MLALSTFLHQACQVPLTFGSFALKSRLINFEYKLTMMLLQIDVWSLGILLIQLYTGRVPKGTTDVAQMSAFLRENDNLVPDQAPETFKSFLQVLSSHLPKSKFVSSEDGGGYASHIQCFAKSCKDSKSTCVYVGASFILSSAIQNMRIRPAIHCLLCQALLQKHGTRSLRLCLTSRLPTAHLT